MFETEDPLGASFGFGGELGYTWRTSQSEGLLGDAWVVAHEEPRP